jgi:hypothetical protein
VIHLQINTVQNILNLRVIHSLDLLNLVKNGNGVMLIKSLSDSKSKNIEINKIGVIR